MRHKQGRFSLWISEQRKAKLINYCTVFGLSVTAMIERWIDSLPETNEDRHIEDRKD